MRPAISIKDISKCYTLGKGNSTSLQDWATSLFLKKTSQQTFWALSDISFTISKGEVFGIIGKNGAGKSTLLKILSRITSPTSGSVEINGRVASLLEVGTGFHPELSGRENIFLNGAILGMSRSEIKSKFNEIVDFSGIETFLDTPVKHYSSGMYVRLAFSVAAHLEPEILIIDEVLAVGDADFQRKCILKMEDVCNREGSTILFVSHNMSAIKNLCTKVLYLKNGKVDEIGSTECIVGKYLSGNFKNLAIIERVNNKDIPLYFQKVFISDENNNICSEIDYNNYFYINIEYAVNKLVRNGIIWFDVRTLDDIIIFGSADYDTNFELHKIRAPGIYRMRIKLNSKFFNRGQYKLVFGAYCSAPLENFDRIDNINFTIIDTNLYPDQELAERPGILKPLFNWEFIS